MIGRQLGSVRLPFFMECLGLSLERYISSQLVNVSTGAKEKLFAPRGMQGKLPLDRIKTLSNHLVGIPNEKIHVT